MNILSFPCVNECGSMLTPGYMSFGATAGVQRWHNQTCTRATVPAVAAEIARRNADQDRRTAGVVQLLVTILYDQLGDPVQLLGDTLAFDYCGHRYVLLVNPA